jgi:fibronectin type 3 domain-containing protein
VNGTILSYNDTSVINGQTYNYYITAINIVGESIPSDKISIIPQTISSSPQNIRAVPGNNYIDLSWEAHSNDGGAEIIKYNIYKSTSPNNEIYVNSVNGSITSYRDMLVKNGIIYYYYITAINSVGESNPSEELSAIPRSKPSPPRNLSISLGDDNVILTWEAPTDNGGFPITEYKIYKGINYGEEQFLTYKQCI